MKEIKLCFQLDISRPSNVPVVLLCISRGSFPGLYAVVNRCQVLAKARVVLADEGRFHEKVPWFFAAIDLQLELIFGDVLCSLVPESNRFQ